MVWSKLIRLGSFLDKWRGVQSFSNSFFLEECLICIVGETEREEGYEKVIKPTSETENYIQSTHEQELNFNSTCRFYRHLQSSI